VRYLVEAISKVLPAVADARVIGTTAGVRPTLYAYGPNEDALSRDHRIVDHRADGARGLFSMIGGKLASYRIFAEQMTDMLVQHLEAPAVPCRTHLAPLPGGNRAPSRQTLVDIAGIDAVAASRLLYRHGSRAERIVERVRDNPLEASVVCPCEPVIEAEVRHVVRHEMAASVDDVARRTRLGLGACGGMRCAARCGQIVADECGMEPRDGARLALRFVVRQAKTRAVAMGPAQASAEALTLASIRSELGPLLEEEP
jgi:glycerol-3-phosphate dehydrogenase